MKNKLPMLESLEIDTVVDRDLLASLVTDMEAIIPAAFPAGLADRRIREIGFYEEAGLRFELEDYAVGQLYAGLAVLARDMHLYLNENPRYDAALFQEVVSLVNSEECKANGVKAFPYYEGLHIADLPQHLAAAAALGRPIVEPLGDRHIVHEWTFKPGKRLFIKFGKKFKETICGQDGPYEQFNKNLLGKAGLPSTIATQILLAGFSPATFWYPLAVYMSILLIKTGLKVYCEPD